LSNETRYDAPMHAPRSAGMYVVLLVAGALTAALAVAVIVVVAYRKYRRAALTSEAHFMLQNIAAGEEMTLASARAYTACPGGPYPRTVPSPTTHAWASPGHPGDACWRALATTGDPVRFVYRVVAGGPGDPIPTPPKGSAIPVQSAPWFVAMASADLDGDGDQSSYWLTSFTPGVYSVDADE
jgi:hypothetical protein